MSVEVIVDLGHWEFVEEFNIDEWFGFVYRIIEISSGREYIGKKQFFSHRTKAVKGRKNRKHFKVESDWKSYTGSSIELNKAIEANAKLNYRFIIESLHKTKGSLHYAEVEMQIKEDVLRTTLPSGERKFYNGHIAAVKFLPPAEHSEESKMKISNSLRDLYRDKGNHWFNKMSVEEKEKFADEFLRGDNNPRKRVRTEEEYRAWLTEHVCGANNPMFGKEPHNKGKTFSELYGEEIAAQMKSILSEKCGRSGEDNGMYGKSHTEDQKEKWSNDPRRKHYGENNGMYGKPCYYAMTEEKIQTWKDNISKCTKGKPKSADHAAKIGLAHRGKKKAELTCPHCSKVGRGGNMKRYHFDNCKHKPS